MKRKGFTTIELLLVVAIMVTVSLVAVVSYTMINNKQKQKDYDVMVKNIKTAAELYLNQNLSVDTQLKTNGQVSIPIQSLVNTGNLEEYYTTNPKDKTSVLEMCVYAIVGEELNNGIRNINYSDPIECGGYLVLSDLNLYLFRLEEDGKDVVYNPVIKVIDENGTVLLNNASKEEYKRGGVEAKTIDNEKELELENLTKGCHTVQFHYEEKIFDRKVCVEDIGYCEIKIKTDEGEETIDKIAHGESITIDEYEPDKEGYIFRGWKIEGTEEKVESITCDNSEEGTKEEIVIEPDWEELEEIKYIVNYYVEDVTGEYTLHRSEDKYGQIKSKINKNEIEKEIENTEYENAKIGTTVLIIDGDYYKNGNEYVTVEEGLEIDLYYKRNVYTLNLSKGTGVSSITATGCTEVTAGSVYTCTYGASVTVTATASTGYTINSTLTGTNIANKTNGTAFTMPVPTSGTSVTLTASAKASTYTLNLSKGTGVSSITATGCTEVTAGSKYTCAYGASVTVTATASTGYTINSTLTGTNIADKTNGTAFTMPVPTSGTSVTLTASAAPKDLTVTFDVNGGSGSNTTKTVTYGQTYGTLASAPSKSCATFAGWYTAASGGNLVTASTKVTNGAPHTLYAHYNTNTSGGTWGSCTGGYCSGCSAASNSGQQTNTCGATRSCTPSASSLGCNKNGSITSDCDDDCGYTYCKTTCGGEVYTNLGSCAPTISCSVSISPNRFTYNKSVSLSTWYITARTTVSGTYNVYTTGYKNGGYCDVNTNFTAGTTYNISGLTTNYCTSTTIDVTSSRSGSKTIYFTITHNSTGTYKTCSWTYSWS